MQIRGYRCQGFSVPANLQVKSTYACGIYRSTSLLVPITGSSKMSDTQEIIDKCKLVNQTSADYGYVASTYKRPLVGATPCPSQSQ